MFVSKYVNTPAWLSVSSLATNPCCQISDLQAKFPNHKEYKRGILVICTVRYGYHVLCQLSCIQSFIMTAYLENNFHTIHKCLLIVYVQNGLIWYVVRDMYDQFNLKIPVTLDNYTTKADLHYLVFFWCYEKHISEKLFQSV